MACKKCQERKQAIRIVANQLKNGIIHPLFVIVVCSWALGMVMASVAVAVVGGP